jgi:predicted nucleotide-binding protein (sugar kinase/HSP70/actin superfamily)
LIRSDSSNLKIGMVQAFIGHYPSSNLIKNFLEELGCEVVVTPRTHRHVIDVGSALASSDLCLPIRTFVGHIYCLCREIPDLDFLVIPAIHSEDGMCSACAKYRDVGGVVVRSLTDTLSYHLDDKTLKIFKEEYLVNVRATGNQVPFILMPDIHGIDEVSMKNVCLRLYAQIKGRPPIYKAAFCLPNRIKNVAAKEISGVEKAFKKAYQRFRAENQNRRDLLEKKLKKEDLPRLGLVGRRYLVDDPGLSCDIKNWFQRQGVEVFTPRDLPRDIQDSHARDYTGYYDAHREGQAFIYWAHDKLDGCICLGSFGCHPDGFQIDYLAEYARSLGISCWTFRYDENTGNIGFITRYETILSFLKQKKEIRCGKTRQISVNTKHHRPKADETGRPLFIWPYMGEILNIVLQDAACRLGLDEYILPPDPIDESIINKGRDKFSQTCSPYACTTGSIKATMDKVLESNCFHGSFKPAEPRRSIIMLMVKGEGPCTLGWYSIAQNQQIPGEYGERLKKLGYDFNLLTLGLEDNHSLKELFNISDSKMGRLISRWLEGKEKGWKKRALLFQILLTAIPNALGLWVKLRCLEGLRAYSLIIRAHEIKTGSVKEAYDKALDLMTYKHKLLGILKAYRQGLRVLKQVPQDKKVLPRVVVVGEIYVMLTSFANRGTTETLLPRAGLEVIEGITLSGYIKGCFQEITRRFICSLPVVKSVINWFRSNGITVFEQKVRDTMSGPFLTKEVGGEGLPSVGRAQYHLLQGCDGLVHLYPFKCMPEAISDDALRELAGFYGVRYLSLTFDKEVEIERLKTEVNTFGVLLHAHFKGQKKGFPGKYSEVIKRRKAYRLLRQIIPN